MNPVTFQNTFPAGPARANANAAAANAPAGSSAADNSTITASDFMTLLVTEMKNQDPTQPTDPSTYIQQLTSVNSLEQLIDVNKQLTSMGGSTSSTTKTTTAGA